MARIDVSEILNDPDLVDPIQIIDRLPRVNSFGESSLQEFPRLTVGSVQPASSRAVLRLPEALRVENLMSFWVKGKIVASESGKYTSVILFNGQRFNVQAVFDWSNWGNGWCEGVCKAEVPAP